VYVGGGDIEKVGEKCMEERMGAAEEETPRNRGRIVCYSKDKTVGDRNERFQGNKQYPGVKRHVGGPTDWTIPKYSQDGDIRHELLGRKAR